ncbi:hypothetical protein K474DRAFT_1674433 [Panus rudis PR-1116 ss-1]|nr:hypothetical protein K474DRAFT_1674433 [Panus rudis PR-1116 ss-1]
MSNQRPPTVNAHIARKHRLMLCLWLRLKTTTGSGYSNRSTGALQSKGTPYLYSTVTIDTSLDNQVHTDNDNDNSRTGRTSDSIRVVRVVTEPDVISSGNVDSEVSSRGPWYCITTITITSVDLLRSSHQNTEFHHLAVVVPRLRLS